ncbi:MAG: hypothetical protein ACTMKY_09770 [Dermabacteraceae bacterium]|uniref:hypothetical protein n=1 Tax=Brachybacterium sp. TaxID=1891286 RepID=UPI00264CD7C2|nr:hypothetical protein [Brachybacterium sp.]MDN6302379.1 hypothetical protein [Brachybacterium sp.]MDN6327793.1 hypothetical protein [Brachybacterium sp.]MDN6400131.1 hypothetical protein [Brachybacterium sp.]
MRPSVTAYAVVALAASSCVNLAVAEGVSGSWHYYFFGPVPMLLSVAFAVVLTSILALTRRFSGPQFALWTPAVLGVLASLLLIVGVLPGSAQGGDSLREMSWMTVSYLALPPLLSALWFEVWETVRLREARAAARAGDAAAAR